VRINKQNKTKQNKTLFWGIVFVLVLSGIYSTGEAVVPVEKDLSSRLPAGGTFTDGTAGWKVTLTGGGVPICYTNPSQGWVGLQTGTQGGTVTLSFPNNFKVDMTDSDIIADRITVNVVFRLNSPSYQSTPDGSIFELLVYGDNSTNTLPLSYHMELNNHSFEQWTPGFENVYFVSTVIPQDFHKISDMVIRYIGGPGRTSEVQIDQVTLKVSRVQL